MVMANKGSGKPLSMITAYDATFARIVDESGVDMILVGDSVGSVVQGVANTIPVTLEEMEYHVKLVIFHSVLTRSIRNRLFAVRFAS
jgi:3-methyl-2-oxobutanoate hydroxymethyltransferase